MLYDAENVFNEKICRWWAMADLLSSIQSRVGRKLIATDDHDRAMKSERAWTINFRLVYILLDFSTRVRGVFLRQRNTIIVDAKKRRTGKSIAMVPLDLAPFHHLFLLDYSHPRQIQPVRLQSLQ